MAWRDSSELLTFLEKSGTDHSVTELQSQSPKLSRRTIQRWLGELVREGRLQIAGKGPSSRYLVAGSVPRAAEEISHLPLSAEAKEILEYVKRPVSARKPVGYQAAFLESYRPNHSAYLPEALRVRLQRMGDTGQNAMEAGTYGRAVLGRLLVDLSWASSHLEGNTYSRLDTQELIEHGKAAEGRAATETQMILNHKAAIELLVENADTIAFNRYTLLNVHSALSENLLPNPADEGRLRLHAVEIGRSVYRPLSVPDQLDEQFELFLKKAKAIEDPFEQSFFAMVHLPYLQPFADMNKRTSRLAANIPFLRENLCPLTFLDVPEPAYSSAILGIYELTRPELLRDLYAWAYERSTQEYIAIRQELAEPDPLRLKYRDVIKAVVREVVQHPSLTPQRIIARQIEKKVPEAERTRLTALLMDTVDRLHEGVLARYGLRPSELSVWRAKRAK